MSYALHGPLFWCSQPLYFTRVSENPTARLFYKKPLYKHLVLDSLKFKKLLAVQGQSKKLEKNSTLKLLPGST